MNPSPSPLLLRPFFLPLSQALLVISFKSYFLYDLFLFPWLYFSCFHFLLSEFNAFLLHASSLLSSFLFFFSLFAPCFSFSYTSFSLFFTTCWFHFHPCHSLSLKTSFPPYSLSTCMLSLSLFVYLSAPLPISPLLALSLLEHCDTVVMVTPIIFWHEWRILY